MEYIYFFILIIFGSILLNKILDHFQNIKEGLTNKNEVQKSPTIPTTPEDQIDNTIKNIESLTLKNKNRIKTILEKTISLSDNFTELSDKIKGAKKAKQHSSKKCSGTACKLANNTIPLKESKQIKIEPPAGLNCLNYVPKVGNPVIRPSLQIKQSNILKKNNTLTNNYTCTENKVKYKIWFKKYGEIEKDVNETESTLISIIELINLALLVGDESSKNMV